MSTVDDEAFNQAVTAALMFLPGDRQATPEEVESATAMAIQVISLKGMTVDRELLAKALEAKTNVYQEDSAALHDAKGHVPWLADAKNDRDWAFWDRYNRYLKTVVRMPPQVVRALDRTTEEVLGELEDPLRPGRWRRTGLVIGQVQSGKTGQYIGLATKAADAGYRLIVVFAGIHNDLRSQTQLRIDEGLLGFDTQYQLRSDQEGSNRKIGVGAMSHVDQLAVASLTNSAEKGDFDRRTASRANLPIGGFPIVLVVKKHRRIIDYLRTWVTEVHGEADETGRKIVRDIPLFVIDDEADNASINTADADSEPTKINEAIRKLVNSFDKAAYVGYTATPFANIYVDSDADHDVLGGDLFPDSFIRALRPPSNYLGPERLFGLRVQDEDEDDIDPLPLVRHVTDTASWIPDKHRSGWVPSGEIPASLRRAIHSFVLTCAARRVRGQVNKHNSMLIHVTRFTAVQGQVRDQVDDYVRFLSESLRDRYGNSSQTCLAELRALWDSDFASTTDYFPTEEAERLSWEAVAEEIVPALLKFKVKAINGAAKDVLDYYENRHKGLSVIAIGGEKLSRGLTLEGLSVSYYLRASKTYDTLLQMGRWFGYRPGYEDLCRLYTTPALESAYAEITAATDELRRDVEEMSVLGLTPSEFGLKVRTSSLGLAITAANKMRQGTRVRLSYSGELPETTIFNLQDGTPQKNLESLRSFTDTLAGLSDPQVDGGSGSLTWKHVPPEVVAAGFFDTYQTAKEAHRVRPQFIADYVRKCAAHGELTEWTVRVVGVQSRQGVGTVDIAGHSMTLVTRQESGRKTPGRHTIKRVLSPKDEIVDLDDAQKARALADTKKAAEHSKRRDGSPRNPTTATGTPLRFQRRPDQPLLLIYPLAPPANCDADDQVPLVGFAVSFPFSEGQIKTEYVVNDVWWKQGADLDFEEYEDDE
ncbi:Z1 domain-containing protein [Streptomyces albidoflavus]|uniref:Z1 domain-containing protein n=1 Tax=Streptomyces TaxID=1883 RepID=UPI001BEAA46B|nr:MULTISPECIES: Z1 domain-containing protein [unclassified Streptomyces]MBT2877732.1 Z1 domain-containing protein [Streptomyces sp. McG6]MBT2883767.1 Z1 domain-containing protein [Streptomyces sp. McG5]MBT2890071.1 Z1 domain-containing protein [Streptomyces sp. McG2]WSB14025.1 Z1 domain-containing protein [Streptomyces albidoflavus]